MKKVLVVLIVLLAVSSAFFYTKSKTFYIEKTKLKKNLDNQTNKKEKLFYYEKLERKIRLALDELPDLIIEKEDGETDLAFNEFKSDTLVLFFYSKLSCSSCLESVLGEVNFNSKDIKNFYLISDYDVKRDLVNFKRRSKLQTEVFNNKTKSFSEVYEYNPFLIVLAKDKTFVFFPDKDWPERTGKFLNLWNIAV